MAVVNALPSWWLLGEFFCYCHHYHNFCNYCFMAIIPVTVTTIFFCYCQYNCVLVSGYVAMARPLSARLWNGDVHRDSEPSFCWPWILGNIVVSSRSKITVKECANYNLWLVCKWLIWETNSFHISQDKSGIYLLDV